MGKDLHLETVCVHGGRQKEATGAIATPIYQTATFAHPAVGQSTGYDYSRTSNPTRVAAERAVAALDGVAHGFAFSTGMAAAACLMELLAPGAHVVAASDLYGGTHRLFRHISVKNGLTFSFADTAAEMAGLVTRDTKMVFIETPTNPTMGVIDIRAAAEAAKAVGAMLVVDNTFLTPVFQRPFELGATVVLYSGTKYLGGHNDTLAGFLTTDDDAVAEKLAFVMKTTGACLSPLDSFLITRGLKTLAIRMKRQEETAMAVAKWLKGRADVSAVLYPGLPDDPGHEICKRQATGFGGMLAFRAADEARARRVLERVRIIQYAESLGGVDSLMTFPMLQTHADVPEAERLARGIDGRLLRLSVGLENAGDLIEDLAQAFEG